MCVDSDTGNYDACNIDITKVQNKQKATNDENLDGETSMESQSSPVFMCLDLSPEMADLKLDLVSLESKLCERIHIIEDKILSTNEHTKEHFNTYGNLTTNAPTKPIKSQLKN